MLKDSNMLLNSVAVVTDEDGESYIPSCEICHIRPGVLLCEVCKRGVCSVCCDVIEYPDMDWQNWPLLCISCQDELEEGYEDYGDYIEGVDDCPDEEF